MFNTALLPVHLHLHLQVVERFKDCIDDFKQIMPLVEELANPALKRRHWEEIFVMIDAEIPLNDEGTAFAPFNVRALLQVRCLPKKRGGRGRGGARGLEWGAGVGVVARDKWAAFAPFNVRTQGTFV